MRFPAEIAQRELGFACRPLNETIADTIAWLKRIDQIAGGK